MVRIGDTHQLSTLHIELVMSLHCMLVLKILSEGISDAELLDQAHLNNINAFLTVYMYYDYKFVHHSVSAIFSVKRNEVYL